MLRFVLKLFLAAAVISVAILAGATLYIVPGLPDINTLKDVRMQVPLRIYTDDLSLISEFGEKRRKPVKIEDVPKEFIDAFIAAEDDRFYQHPGVDWQGILRASINLVLTGRKSQGGSTITMQVARNFFLSREKSYLRKLNEIFLALKIDHELSKQEILELYLNKIYLGQRAYGIGAAAQVYYGLGVNQLSLAQMAMIAGLPKAPSSTNPVSDPHRARIRRTYVLTRMRDLGYITKQQFDKANAEPLSASLHSPNIEINAPYISEMARTKLVSEYGEEAYSAGYRVITTIHDRDQVAANRALRSALLEYDRRHGYRGPEQHFTLKPDQTDKQDLQHLLQPFSNIGSLYPAIVTDVGDQSVTAYLAGTGKIKIDWDGLKWARKYITENIRGPQPKTAGEILKPGDIIRVIQDKSGNWQLSQIPAVEGALVSLRPDDGATLALVGGFDYSRSKFNRVIQAKRQPGSSFKPFIYSAALEAGFTAATIINDAPVVFKDPGLEDIWRPENYHGEMFGPTRMREGLVHSLNLVSIRILHAIGIQFALQHVAKFGFDVDSLPHNLSLALGSGAVSPWRMAAAYCIFANGGYRVDPYYIDHIETYGGKSIYKADPLRVCHDCSQTNGAAAAVKVAANQPSVDQSTATADADPDVPSSPPPVQLNKPAPPATRVAPRVVNPQNIWIMDSMTRSVIAHGTGRAALVLKRTDLSGKTGTTNDQRDAWFAGFNPDIVTVCWVGFDNFSPLGRYETGARAALPMWIKYMRVALKGDPQHIMQRPNGLVDVRIDSQTGKLATADDPNAMFEVFKVGTAPTQTQTQVGGKNPFNDQGQGKIPDQLF